jgi:hypothetical protein
MLGAREATNAPAPNSVRSGLSIWARVSSRDQVTPHFPCLDRSPEESAHTVLDESDLWIVASVGWSSDKGYDNLADAASRNMWLSTPLRRQTLSLPTHNEIRETINRSGCDLFAFYENVAGTDPDPEDQCFIHSVSHRDTELLAVDILRDDAPAVSGMMTSLINGWESHPLKPGETCLAAGCNLMLSVVEPPKKLLDEILGKAVRAAVDYRGNKDFSVLILVPARRLTDEEVERITTSR